MNRHWLVFEAPVTSWHLLFSRDYEILILYLKVKFIEFQTGKNL